MLATNNYDVPLPMFPGPAENPWQYPEDDEFDMIPMDYNPLDDDTALQQGMQMLGGLPTVIESQEQWDALPGWAKDLVRAQATGAQFSEADVARFALNAMQEERRAQKKPEVIELGGQQYILHPSGNVSPLRQEPAATTERIVDEQGFIRLLDKKTGVATRVTDEEGNPIRAQERMTSMGLAMQGMDAAGQRAMIEDMVKANQELAVLQQRLQTDGPDAKLGFFGGKTIGQRIAELQAKVDTLQGSAPQGAMQEPAMMPEAGMPGPMSEQTPMPTPQPMPTPAPTPQPNPMPTPQPAATPPLVARNPQTGETLIWNGSQWVPQ